MKRIQIYPSIENIHTAYNSLIKFPPKGYRFIGKRKSKKMHLMEKFKKNKILRFSYKFFLNMFKSNKLLTYFYKSNKISKASFIYSLGVIYKGKDNWILEILDNPYSLTGYNYKVFIKEKDKLEKILLQKNCKKIICTNLACLEILKNNFSLKIINKTELIYTALETKKIIKKQKINKYFNILFMGSINNPSDFLIKGGVETLEIIKYLTNEFPNIRAIIKCSIPEDIKKFYSFKNIKIIENKLSEEELKKIYLNADILLMPGHSYFLMAFLEAMSFGLPIITLDTYAVKDYVINKKTGFTIIPSNKIPYTHPSYPANIRSVEFISAIKNIDERVIKDFCNKIELLIKNPKIKNNMSNQCLKIIQSKFSIKKRNKKLKKIFDEIIEN